MKSRSLIAALLTVSLACRPVLTIGWGEIAILIVLLATLIGPALVRLYRRWDEFSRWRGKKS
ncbi:MAG: hypothetical protein FJ010_01415 [Chloroflexi bacterium]|nr:hypothetical protein [Chloroflexota bacterium]